MIAFALLLSAIGQKFVMPSPGDTITLGDPEPKGYVGVSVDYFAMLEWSKFTMASDSAGQAEMQNRGRVLAVEKGTKVLFLKKHEQPGDEPDLAEVRIQSGEFAGKAGWTFLANCIKPDPAKEAARLKAEADARALAEKKAKRKPLDPKVIAADLTAAISGAKSAASKLGRYQAAQKKEQMVKDAIEKVRLRHAADPDELLAIANGAKPPITVNFDGKVYDVAGRRIK